MWRVCAAAWRQVATEAGWSGRVARRSDMETMRASKRFHALDTKGRYLRLRAINHDGK